MKTFSASNHLPLRSTLLLLLFGVTTLAACGPEASQPGSGGSGGGSGGSGGSGGAPPVTCAWTKKTSNATCAAGACPILLDEELACDDREFAAPGLRVAPAPDATWLATSSQNDRQVYRLAGGVEEVQDTIPKEFTRNTMPLAVDKKGGVQLVGDTTTFPNYVGGLTHLALVDGKWTSSLVFDQPDKFTPVIDFEVGSDDRANIWFVGDAPEAYTLATPDGQGGWALAPQSNAFSRFTLAGDGSTVALVLQQVPNAESRQLHALIGGVDKPYGSPISAPEFLSQLAIAAAPMPSPPADALFAAAVDEPAGVRVITAFGASKVNESVIAGAVPSVPVCVTPLNNPDCMGTCHEISDGMEPRTFAIAWTDDGTAWFTYVETSVDQTIGYSLQGDPGAEFCVGNVLEDKSTGTLHLIKIPQDGSAPKEALTMPIERPGGGDAFGEFYSSGRFIDARGFGKDLAIGVRTGWVGGPNAVRLLRVDTTKL